MHSPAKLPTLSDSYVVPASSLICAHDERMPVGDHDHLVTRIPYQPFKKVDHLKFIETAFENLKSHSASIIDCRDNVTAKSFSSTTYDRSLTRWGVSSAGLVIATKPSLIFPINLSFFTLCEFFYLGVVNLKPFTNCFIIAL